MGEGRGDLPILIDMAIKLWQRKQGFLQPPDEVLHAEPDSRGFPETYRNRIVRWTGEVFRRAYPPEPFGFSSDDPFGPALTSLCHDLAEAYGRPILVPLTQISPPITAADREGERQIPLHLSRCSDFEVLDLIDAVFQKLDESSQGYAGIRHELLTHAATRLNAICAEEGIGYRWVDGELIRYDDPVTHEEAVRPAIDLLSSGRFGEANAEFRRALECYRTGAWRDAITNASAAFESVLKVVTRKGNLTAGPLIAEARRQGVIPAYAQNAAENLEKLMNVVPAIRGQHGAHGLGEREREADEHLARLVVATAASFIVFVGRERA